MTEKWRLRKLRITNIDRVGSGSNPLAHAVIYKSASADPDNTGGDMSDDTTDETSELDPEVTTQMQELSDLLAERDAELAELTRLREEDPAALAELLGLEIAKTEPEEEDVIKSLPDEVQERIAKAEAELAQLRKNESRRHFVDIAKSDLDDLTETADDLGEALLAVSEAVGEDSEVWKTVHRVLKSAAAQAAEATKILSAEMGTTAGDSASNAEEQILAKAQEIASEQGLDIATAMTEVRKSNPDLYRAYEAERSTRSRR